VFDHLGQMQWGWTGADRGLANAMATYWTNFARSGDPNSAGVPAWQNFTAGNERLMHFDGAVVMGGLPNREGLHLLDERFTKLRAATLAQRK
jgi:para-nitrobenzyl esterase